MEWEIIYYSEAIQEEKLPSPEWKRWNQMMTHEELKNKILSNPDVKSEYDTLKE